MKTKPVAIEIFKPGTFTAMNGRSFAFTAAAVAAMAAAYSVDLHEAPIVLGHPKDDAPAYGWVKGLEVRDDGTVVAQADELEPAFTEAVRNGRYKKVSASFYLPDAPNNPKPGTYYLRHVGFLGAQPPAVKGLKSAEFAGGDEDCITVDFSDDLDVARLLRSLREWLIGQFGTEEADKALPSWYVDTVQESAAANRQAERGNFAESQDTPKGKGSGATASRAPGVARGKAKASEPSVLDDEKEQELLAREEQCLQRERAVERQANAAFLDGLVAQGRPLPIAKDTLLELFTALTHGPEAASFTEGLRAVDVLRDALSKLPKQVDLSERAPAGAPEPDELDAEAIGKAAADFIEEQRTKGILVTATDAVKHVREKLKGAT